MSVRHFLSFMNYSPEELIGLIHCGSELKDLRNRGMLYEPLESRVLGTVSEKASAHVRLSLEVGMIQLGGQTILLSPHNTQLGRGEPIGDNTRVVSRVLDDVMARTFAHVALAELTAYSKVPVINDLSDGLHPCQLLAGMQTSHEHCGSIQGKTVVWIGDSDNMYNSYIEVALKFNFQLRMACPEGYKPKAEFVVLTGGRLRVVRDPHETVTGAHLVSTDAWASMGQEDEAAACIALFRLYQVNVASLNRAADDVLFIHCLPAHRGKEISEELLDDPRSVAWDQAENRPHVQKVLLKLLVERAHYV